MKQKKKGEGIHIQNQNPATITTPNTSPNPIFTKIKHATSTSADIRRHSGEKRSW
jgi:hypothetical protein